MMNPISFFIRWRARRKFFKCTTPEAHPSDFFLLKYCMESLIVDFECGNIMDPKQGICVNARLLSNFPTGFRTQFWLFICMVRIFNKEVRGVKTGKWNVHPFADIDGRASFFVNRWEGAGGEVRVACMKWIVEQIEKYQLDS